MLEPYEVLSRGARAGNGLPSELGLLRVDRLGVAPISDPATELALLLAARVLRLEDIVVVGAREMVWIGSSSCRVKF